jgi:hypothetical protein
VRCNSRSPANAACGHFRSVLQPNHDRVADAIEIVISRHSLAMLPAVPVDEFVLKYQKPL